MSIKASLVRLVLEKAFAYTWTVQGFGMLRTKIADVGRIHIWDSRLRVPLVSDIHAHPWPLHSTIISGELVNQRFSVSRSGSKPGAMPYCGQKIATGEGGGLVDVPDVCWLTAEMTEFFVSGGDYFQSPTEVHRSMPIDGTVTLLERPQGPPLQQTCVYWPAGTSWVSAEPRPAKEAEIERAISFALARWNG